MWRIDSIVDFVNDTIGQYYQAAFAPTEEAKKAGFEKFYGTTFPFFLEKLEARLKENTSPNFFVGDNYTIADFAFVGVAFSTFENESNPSRTQQKEIVDKYPLITAYITHAKEASKEFLASRKSSPW
jgi:glutathione S-transferase